jgi:hypothetical protein
MLNWTVFPSLYRPEDWSTTVGTWWQLTQVLAAFKNYVQKDQCPLWSPYALKEGSRHENAAVSEICCLVLDFDQGTPDWSRFSELTFIAHTTWSHTKEAPKWRVVLPLDRPVPAVLWKGVWSDLRARLAPDIDPSCKDVCRWYYLPSSPKGAPQDVKRGSGQILSWGALEETPGAAPAKAPTPAAPAPSAADLPATLPLERRDLVRAVAALKRVRNEKQQALASVLSLVLQGRPYSEEGGRNGLLFELLGALKTRLPLVSGERLYVFFKDSLEATDGAPTQAQFLSQWARVRSENSERAVAAMMAEELATSYTEQQLLDIADVVGFPIEDLKTNRYWFAYTSGSDVFRLEMSGYAPIVLDSSTVPSLKTSRFRPDIVLSTAEGKLISPAQLLEMYGIGCKEITYTYGPTTFDWPDDTERPNLRVNCVKLRDEIVPVFSKMVDNWLKVFAGDRYAYLCQWIANLSDLTAPDNLLALMGEKNTGKSLFLAAVGSLYSKNGAIDIESATERFNAELMHCPIIVKDEANDLHDKSSIEDLKRLVTSPSMRTEQKGRPVTRIDGCCRVIVTSNNLDWCDNYAAMINDGGLSAAASRLFPIFIDPEAAKVVPERKDFSEVLSHFRLLVEAIPFKQYGRFTLPDELSAIVEQSMGPTVKQGPELQILAALRKMVSRTLNGMVDGLDAPFVNETGIVFRIRAILSNTVGTLTTRTARRYTKRLGAVERNNGLWHLSFDSWAGYERNESAEQLKQWCRERNLKDENDVEKRTWKNC